MAALQTDDWLALKIIIWGIVGIIFLIAIFGSFFIVGAGERGVLLTFSKASMTAYGPGIHYKAPFIQHAVKMDVQTQKYQAELTAASKDLQDVKTTIAINYHLIPENVPSLYVDIGLNYAEKVIYPLEQEANKATTAQFTAVDLIGKREDVKEQMKTLLTARLQPRGIIVEEISIVDFQFSPSFTAAIEQKVTAEQLALAAQNKLAQVQYEAQQRVAQAEGEARAITIQVEAIRQNGGAAYVNLQAISKWNGALPIVVGGNSMPFINIPNAVAGAAVASGVVNSS